MQRPHGFCPSHCEKGGKEPSGQHALYIHAHTHEEREKEGRREREGEREERS